MVWALAEFKMADDKAEKNPRKAKMNMGPYGRKPASSFQLIMFITI